LTTQELSCFVDTQQTYARRQTASNNVSKVLKGGLMADILVDDPQYIALQNLLTSLSDAVSFTMCRYNTLLDALGQRGVTEGQFADNFKAFALQAKLMEDKVGLLIEDIQEEIDSYLADIDEADRYLYGAKPLRER
jgi:hypothetical protein